MRYFISGVALIMAAHALSSENSIDRERYEKSYSLRAVMKILKPVRAISNDYQDARIIEEDERTTTIEFTIYPLNNEGRKVEANPDWRSDNERDPALQEYLKAGVTTNWDAPMRAQLVKELKAAGIDPEKLDDKILVEQTVRWLLKNTKQLNMFCTYDIEYSSGAPRILPALEPHFQKNKGHKDWSVEQQLEHELFGRSMFLNKTCGTCTSTAVYLTTVLRALGIPTRMILTVPIVDGNNRDEVELLRTNLRHHRVRNIAYTAALDMPGFCAHTFNEVYVGKRWVRLNFSVLGHNILDPNCFGLIAQVNSFNDLSEVKLAETWGIHSAITRSDADFPSVNPYRCLKLSDHFGEKARIENPPLELRVHRTVTIGSAAWGHAKETPYALRSITEGLPQDRKYLLLHAEEWFDDQPGTQFRPFKNTATKKFKLVAGGDSIPLLFTYGYCTSPEEKLREFITEVSAADYERMSDSAEYELVPVDQDKNFVWNVKEGLRVRKPTAQKNK
ncbi:MAG TPA: transglutaminase domain-containing protein [Planctomycetota bacterium]|nr:transglutaminase domain-containing protein [Planctomycetota bacterium]